MADINVYLEQILSAVYGEDVRGAIHDAINAINNDVLDVVSVARTAQNSAAASANAAASSVEEAETIVSGMESRITVIGNNMISQLASIYSSSRDSLIEIQESVYGYDQLARGSAEAAESAKDLAGDYMANAGASAHEAQEYRDSIMGYDTQCRNAAEIAQDAMYETEANLEQTRNYAEEVEAFWLALENNQAIYGVLLDSDNYAIADNNGEYINSCLQLATGEDVTSLRQEIDLLRFLIRKLELRINELTA